ncbi:MAG: LysR substrate-binding domain-containing protein [Hyphomicrobiaceae bacterium]
MDNLKSSLPPLATLATFEAAARHSSFTAAAAELHVTQAAVSRQIRQLEDHLGHRLFVRAHRAVALTREGRDFLHTVTAALTHIADASRELKASDSHPRLTIGADQSAARLWLMPVLAAFCARAPQITLRLVISDDDDRLLSDDLDLAILHGAPPFRGHESALVFPERVFPVASPGYLASRAPLAGPADLAAERLIDLEDEHGSWLNWRIWLTAHGVGPAGPRAFTADSYPAVIAAAREGLGIALGWQGLVDRDLAEGRLVPALEARMATRFGYHLVWPSSRERAAVQIIAADFILRHRPDWARGEAAEPGQTVEPAEKRRIPTASVMSDATPGRAGKEPSRSGRKAPEAETR